MNTNIIQSILKDCHTAQIQGETKFIGQLYGDMLFKIRVLAEESDNNVDLLALRDKFYELNGSFFSLVQEFSDVQLKLKENEKSKN